MKRIVPTFLVLIFVISACATPAENHPVVLETKTPTHAAPTQTALPIPGIPDQPISNIGWPDISKFKLHGDIVYIPQNAENVISAIDAPQGSTEQYHAFYEKLAANGYSIIPHASSLFHETDAFIGFKYNESSDRWVMWGITKDGSLWPRLADGTYAPRPDWATNEVNGFVLLKPDKQLPLYSSSTMEFADEVWTQVWRGPDGTLLSSMRCDSGICSWQYTEEGVFTSSYDVEKQKAASVTPHGSVENILHDYKYTIITDVSLKKLRGSKPIAKIYPNYLFKNPYRNNEIADDAIATALARTFYKCWQLYDDDPQVVKERSIVSFNEYLLKLENAQQSGDHNDVLFNVNANDMNTPKYDEKFMKSVDPFDPTIIFLDPIGTVAANNMQGLKLNSGKVAIEVGTGVFNTGGSDVHGNSVKKVFIFVEGVNLANRATSVGAYLFSFALTRMYTPKYKLSIGNIGDIDHDPLVTGIVNLMSKDNLLKVLTYPAGNNSYWDAFTLDWAN